MNFLSFLLTQQISNKGIIYLDKIGWYLIDIWQKYTIYSIVEQKLNTLRSSHKLK